MRCFNNTLYTTSMMITDTDNDKLSFLKTSVDHEGFEPPDLRVTSPLLYQLRMSEFLFTWHM